MSFAAYMGLFSLLGAASMVATSPPVLVPAMMSK